MERDDALPRRLDQLLAELDRLGEDDLLLGGEQGDLADLLEVHPDRVVDPDHVGRERLELLGGGLLELLRVELRRPVDRQLRVAPRRPRRRPRRVDVVARLVGGARAASIGLVLVVLVLVLVDFVDAAARDGREAGELGLLEVGLGRAAGG